MMEKKILLCEDLAEIIKDYCMKRFLQHEQEGITTSSYGILLGKESSDNFCPIGIYFPKSNVRREGKTWTDEMFTGRGFEDKKRGFCMDSEEQIELFISLQEKKQKIIGIFHAHPELPERYHGVSFTPTLFDIKYHYDDNDVWCMIVYLKKNHEADIHTFEINKKEEKFQEIPLQLIKKNSAIKRMEQEISPGFFYTKIFLSYQMATL